MSKDMFSHGFDPYDALIELNNRVTELEKKHNRLAHAYERTQRDLDIALSSIQGLQKGQMLLNDLVRHTNKPR